MSKVTRNEVQSVTPEAWASMLQPALRKNLVSTAITNTRFEPHLKVGDTFHYSYFSGDNTVVAYEPFATIDNHEKLETTGETLVVDQMPLIRKHVDDVEQLYINVNAQLELADEAGYALRDYIDQYVFGEVENADVAMNDGDPITYDGTSGMTVFQVFANATKTLGENNVEQGNWVSVINYDLAMHIELAAARTGFRVADATFRNGYAGDFMGFRVFVSNNLKNKEVGGYNCDTAYFGRPGMVHMAMKERPTVRIKDIPDSLGEYIYFNSVFGTKTFDRYSKRFLKGYLRKDAVTS